MYKFETHLHTVRCSACAGSTHEEVINAAVNNGYAGLVVTNHFYHGNTAIDRDLPWEEFVNAYRDDYIELKELGAKSGIQVFFGLEEVFAPGREMLIYGIEPEIFIAHPEFNKMDVKSKVDFIHKNGGLCVCAHPFRNRSYIPFPDSALYLDLFDGIEGYNKCNNPEDNVQALLYALNNGKFITSGGDCHHAKNFGGAGISFDKKIKNYSDFIKQLKKGNFTLINPYNFD